MLKQEHVHRLKRHTYTNGTKIYFCTLPKCHYKVDVHLALGKESLCNQCGQEFIMNEYSIKLAKPHCANCGKMKVEDGEGKVKFISRHRAQKALAEVAQDSTRSLRERLGSVVTMEKDEDI